MRNRWIITLGMGCMFLSSATGFEIAQISKLTNGVIITLSAEIGKTYQVESAASILGPWQAQASLNVSSNVVSWADTEIASQNQRFYRVANSGGMPVRGALLAGDAVAREVGALGSQSSDIGTITP
jgi:hypothetical protein